MSESCCPGNRLCRPNRRTFLTVGALGTMSLTLGDLMRLESRGDEEAGAGAGFGKAKSIIHIFLPGGMAHQESFDPKPFAPLEYRGSFGTTKTKIPGELFSESMTQMAQMADRITVIRSMTHGEAAHERGTHNMFTGQKPSPAVVFPSIGSVISHELGVRANLPPYVCIPNQPNVYAGTGYLGSSYGPFSLGADPASKGFKVRDLSLPSGVDADRFAKRRTALEAVNAHFASLEKSDALSAMDTFYQAAYNVISSPEARAAFDIEAEPAKLRDDYGRNAAGQRLLMARRLVQAGVRVVTLTYGSWDAHVDVVGNTRSQMPPLDQALATLLRDMESSGLLEETVIMVSSEFGRTPKINATAGRDHWPKVFSVMLAGAGIAKGNIFGTSDATASEPDSNPVGPEDLYATIYHLLGVQHDKKLMAPGGRPTPIIRDGKVRSGLLA